MITEKDKNDIVDGNFTITYMKVLATILVIYIHGANIFGYAGTDIPVHFRPFMSFAESAVPLFMMISGFLLFKKEIHWEENLKKKTIRLAVPFLIWSSFWILMEAIGHVVLPGRFRDVLGWSLADWLISIFGIPFCVSPLYRPIWYVRDLFLLSLVAPVLQKPFRKNPALWAVVAGIIWLAPIALGAREALTFFILGGVLSTQKEYLVKLHYLCSSKLCLFTLFFGVLFSLLPFDVCYRVSILLMIIVVYLLCKLTKELQFINKSVFCIIPYSFAIYVLHGKLLSSIQILYSSKFESLFYIGIGYFLIPFFVFCICLVLSIAFKRILPNVYSICVGEGVKNN